MCPQEEPHSNTPTPPTAVAAGTEAPGPAAAIRAPAGRPVAPVIPPAAARQGSRRRGGGLLPLAGPPPGPPGPAGAAYALGRVDASGRIIDRSVTGALGWRAGDRLTLTADAGALLARRDPGGMVTLPTRPRIAIPASLRRRCGLHAGDGVLLAALPGQDALAAWPLAVVDQALRAHATFPGDEGRRP